MDHEKYKMNIKLPNYIASGFLLLYLIIGIFLASDYGVNWDDDVQRLNGLNNWEFITGHDTNLLKQSTDKYHGPAIEILLVAIEKAFHLTDFHDIFVMRHCTVFIFFVIGMAFFYLLCKMLFNSSWLGLTGMLMLILTPRIFGEAFYNPKDIPFLVAMIIVTFSLLLFCIKPTYKRALFHAFACALAIGIRVIGIIFIPITFLLTGLFLYQRKISPQGLWKKVLLFFVAEFVLMMLMWPILLTNPFEHLWYAYKQLSNYTLWNGINRYMGARVEATHTPWHYHWVWMLISLPEIYIAFSVAGILLLIRASMKKGFMAETKNVFLCLILFLFLFPLVFRNIKNSLVYDGWRHIYFVYPFLLVFAVYALDQANKLRSKAIKTTIFVLLGLGMCESAFQIVSMHPFEYVYFNQTARTIFKPIDRKFEMDYWGVSYKQGFEYILAHRKDNETIKVAWQNHPGEINYQFLTPAQRKMIVPSDKSEANYFLANYRDFLDYPDCPKGCDSVHLIHTQGNVVMGIYKLR